MVPRSPDPLRMYLVLRRGAIATLARAGELAGGAAVACLRAFADDPDHQETIAQWRERPGKVCLRARTLHTHEPESSPPPESYKQLTLPNKQLEKNSVIAV
jgi:hypothetical protein